MQLFQIAVHICIRVLDNTSHGHIFVGQWVPLKRAINGINWWLQIFMLIQQWYRWVSARKTLLQCISTGVLSFFALTHSYGLYWIFISLNSSGSQSSFHSTTNKSYLIFHALTHRYDHQMESSLNVLVHLLRSEYNKQTVNLKIITHNRFLCHAITSYVQRWNPSTVHPKEYIKDKLLQPVAPFTNMV